MEQCVNVERELDKVLHNFSGYGQQCDTALEELLQYIKGLREELTQAGEMELSGTLSLVLSQCCKRIKDTVQKLAVHHKDIHSSVSRVGKAIDKNLDSDLGSVGIEGCWQAESQRLLSEVMVEHFFRQGVLDVAEELCQEAGLCIDPSQREPFVELNRILEALKLRDLRPALQWAVENREMLMAQNSSLEFKLHSLSFIRLLMGGTANQREALQYAKNFQPFAGNHQKDIQVLMGSLVYLRQGIENSPYVHLLDSNQWSDICDIFTRDACSLLGLSVESPLSVSFSAGCVALPALINIKAVIEQRQCMGVWNQKDELPIEVDLGKRCWYHSVFACPILRQQTTESNPPMKLVCGHIISKDALNKMINGSKLKCPYCPMEQVPADAKQIYF
ncbi:protein RMD5A-like [Scleropages formosus]|uniref:Protein RMD5A-like n=1 Tax=Scleropages formosus TaxID=113540 RepID=A0A0P7UN95_SCLFO|nr:E3 ubiquitin-protein transferase RMND5A [Scleropages formosus]XP_029113863.1 E3 ubiquitin-protein transferase RMND5A [Scleropages formosus]KPP70400.1 protein RMD5A-like [Scleropages formosus]